MNKLNFKFPVKYLAIIALIFTLSCSGEDGDIGPVGQDGIDGVDGVNGTDGADGTDGTNGQDGTDGSDGTDGADGADGQDGANGADGQDGSNFKDFLEDFNGPTISTIFTSNGDANWARSSYSPGSGVASQNNGAIFSGDITHNQQSDLFMDVDMPIEGVCSFQLEISSEVNFDFITWYVNGQLVEGISGQGGPFTFHISLPAGQNQVKWTYAKDNSNDGGDDQAIIDNVIITNYETARIAFPELPSTVSLLSEKQAGVKK